MVQPKPSFGTNGRGVGTKMVRPSIGYPSILQHAGVNIGGSLGPYIPADWVQSTHEAVRLIIPASRTPSVFLLMFFFFFAV